MGKLKQVMAVTSGMLVVVAAQAAEAKLPKTKVTLETCIAAVMAAHSGVLRKLEAKSEKGVPIYEFDVESPDGKAWDIECSARTGKVVEIEQEVKSADDPLFKDKAKVGLEDAQKKALAAHPGEIMETEFEIESDGKASYEFDIKTKGGREWKVEVDAGSGEIVEANEEFYQIGAE